MQIVCRSSSNRMKLLKNIEKGLEFQKEARDIQILENDKYKQIYQIINTYALIIDEKSISQEKILTERKNKKIYSC